MGMGAQLKSLREKSGESLQQVADKVGVSKAHVWELEKERSANPSFELVRKLAEHFGVAVEVLTGQAAEPTAEDVELHRMHRELKDLSERDRRAVASMIEALKRTPGGGEPER